MPVLEYRLGQEVERKGLKWLVVRIVEKDSALVVNDNSELCVSTETYVMLKCVNGEIDFETLLHEEQPCTYAVSIPALPNLWRKS